MTAPTPEPGGQIPPEAAKQALTFVKTLATEPEKLKQQIDVLNGDKAASDAAINTAIQTTANLLSRTVEGQTTTYGDRLTELKKDALGKLTPEESADAEKVNEALVNAARQLEGEMKGSNLDPKDMELLNLDPISSLEAISPNNPNQPKAPDSQAAEAKAKVESLGAETKKDETDASAEQQAKDANTAADLQKTQDVQPPLEPGQVLDALAKGQDAVSKLTEGRSTTEEQKVQEVVKNLKEVLGKDTKFTEDPLYKTQLEGVVNAEKDKIAKELTAADPNLQGDTLEAKVQEQLDARMEDLQLTAAVHAVAEILTDPAKADQYKDSPFVQEMQNQGQEKKSPIETATDKLLADAPAGTKDFLTGKDTGDPATRESRLKAIVQWYKDQPTWAKVLIIMFLLQIASHALALIAPLYTIGLAGGQLGAVGKWGAGAVGVWDINHTRKVKEARATAQATEEARREGEKEQEKATAAAANQQVQAAQQQVPVATQGGTDSAGEAEDTATGNDETSPQTPPVQQPETTPVVPPAPSHPDQGQQSPEPPQQPTPDSPQAPTPPKPQTPPPGGQPGPGTGPAA